MARLWRLSVVVTVLTLAPMQAWAECAWVLWQQFGLHDGTKSDWEPIQGYQGTAIV